MPNATSHLTSVLPLVSMNHVFHASERSAQQRPVAGRVTASPCELWENGTPNRRSTREIFPAAVTTGRTVGQEAACATRREDYGIGRVER
jgi:hypothetical protein